MPSRFRLPALLLFALLLTACASSEGPQPRVMQPDPYPRPDAVNSGWIPLFDGTTASLLANFRNYNSRDLSVNWAVRDGSITNPRPAGDFITRNRYGSFDLRFSFKIPPGHNSGVMYKVIEQPGAPSYHSGPEYQIIDDTIDGLDPEGKQSTGANYDIHAPSQQASRPAGQWNRARIVVDGNHVEHWLNGVKVVEYEIGSEDWSECVANSKFNEWPEYARAARGHIAFQDHGDRVYFRDIRIRPLD